MMDIAGRQRAPRSLDGAAAQPAYPWRGRITCDPAPGQPGSPDKTSAAADADRGVRRHGRRVRLRHRRRQRRLFRPGRVVLPPLRPALRQPRAAAGGVDAFLIGIGAARPHARALGAGALSVRRRAGRARRRREGVLGRQPRSPMPPTGPNISATSRPTARATSISSSIRCGRQPHIDAVGIDDYWPLADWRDGTDQPTAWPARPRSTIWPISRANIAGGEGYDWYYASAADRDAQIRTPITDGAYGKPWVFRSKDIRSWWLSQHYRAARRRRAAARRPPGCRSSKPIWFTELGCPAVDKGANQPNVFVDPKSSESALPYFSQRRARRSHPAPLSAGVPRRLRSGRSATTSPAPIRSRPSTAAGWSTSTTCTSTTWDARPYPAFPADTDVWGDGRQLAARPLAHRAGSPARRSPRRSPPSSTTTASPTYDAGALTGMRRRLRHRPRALRARGPAAARARLLHRRARERRPHRLRASAARSRRPPISTPDLLVERSPDQALADPDRAQETDLPASAKLTYISAAGDYPPAVEEARRLVGQSGRIAVADLPLVLEPEQAAAHGRDLAVRGLGGARARRLRAAAEPRWRSSRATPCRSPSTVARACCASPRSASTATATSRRAASIPTSTPAPRRCVGPSPRRPDRHRRPAAGAVPRPAAAARRRAALRWLRRRRPEPVAGRHRLLPLAGKLGLPAQGRRAGAGHVTGVTLDPLSAGRNVPLRPCQHVPRRARPGRARLRHRAGPARRRQHCGHRERGRRLGGAAVPVGRAGGRVHLRAVASSCAARRGTEAAMRSPLPAGARFVLLDGRHHAPSTWRPARSASPTPGAAARPTATSAIPPMSRPRTRSPARASSRSARRTCAAAARPAISPSPGCAARASAATAGTPSRCRLAEETRALRGRHPRRHHRQAHAGHHRPRRHLHRRRADRRLRRPAALDLSARLPAQHCLRPRHPRRQRRCESVRW